MKSLNTKPASLLQTMFIMLYSACITMYFSMRVILMLLTTKNNQREAKSNTFIYRWSTALLNSIKVSYTVHNKFNFEPHKKYIVMCNHNSLYDIPLSFMAVDNTLRMIAKKELSKIPLLGRAMRMVDFIFIDRKNREQALLDLALAKTKMQEGIIIWICPEGKRSRDGKLLPLKTGGFMLALETGATIVPLGIRGSHELLPADTVRVLQGQHIDLFFGNPIDATHYTVENKQQLIADVERELKRAANLS